MSLKLAAFRLDSIGKKQSKPKAVGLSTSRQGSFPLRIRRTVKDYFKRTFDIISRFISDRIRGRNQS